MFTSTIAMDTFLSVLILAFYLYQYVLSINDELNYLHIGACMMGRSYLKFPIAIALLGHHKQLQIMQAEQNQIHPKGESVEFTSYKEKVLYIIKKIRK